MIKFILLLPVKLLGLLFMGIGAALKASEVRRSEAERVRVAQAKQDERERLQAEREEQRRRREAERATRAARVEAARIQREAKQREAEHIRKEREAERAAKVAEAEQFRAAKAAERVREADADLAHLEIMREDLRKMAEYAESLLETASTDAQKEAATKKLMAANQRIRSVDRQRERLQFIISTGGR